MQKTLHSVGLIHQSNPRAEAGVGEPVTKATDGVANDKNRPWRVDGKDNKGDDMANRCHDSDAAPAKLHVDTSVSEGGDGVAGKRREKDERYNSVAQIIIRFQLSLVNRVVTLAGTLSIRKGSELQPRRRSFPQ